MIVNETDRVLMTTVWLSLGVAPLDNVNFDINKMLACLPPDEARRMRRKFRKLWRKYAKRDISAAKTGVSKRNVQAYMGIGEEKPTRAQRNNRKRTVFWGIRKDVLEPLKKIAQP